MHKQDTPLDRIRPAVYSRDQHSISRAQIDRDALKIMYRLIRHNFKAYLVGGGVRDLLLKKKPKDFDIGTDATPSQIRSLFRNCRIIGRRFRLAHIFFGGGKVIEVSTFRDISSPVDVEDAKDQKKFGPAAPRDNRYGSDKTDALRRDITINGLFYDLATFSIIDYVGGMEDLRARIIRVIGDPDVRIAEDPVRMIRIIRHAVRSQFTIENQAEHSIRKNTALIESCSPVRVYEELRKDLSSGYCFDILRLIGEYTLLRHLMPELIIEGRSILSQQNELVNSLRRLDDLVLCGRSVSTTVVLGLIALHACSSMGQARPNPADFRSERDLLEGFDRCFKALAVPKKERLRIEDLLRLWLRGGDERSRRRGAAGPRDPIYTDLHDLMECLGEKPPRMGQAPFVARSEEGNRPAPSRRQHRNRRYRRGPKPRMF